MTWGQLYILFGWITVALYLCLAAVSALDHRPRESAIAILFAASNAAIYLWR